AGVRFTEELAPEFLGGEDPWQEPRLLLLRTMRQERRSDEIDADATDQLRRPGPGQLLDDDVVLQCPEAAPAVRLGPGDAHPARRGQGTLPAPSERDRLGEVVEPWWEADAVGPREVFPQPGPERVAQHLLLGGGAEIHPPQHGTAASTGDIRVSRHRRLRRRGLRPFGRPTGFARGGGRAP